MNKPVSKTLAKEDAYPMVAGIDDQVRTSVPPELVAWIKGTKSKKQIGSAVILIRRLRSPQLRLSG